MSNGSLKKGAAGGLPASVFRGNLLRTAGQGSGGTQIGEPTLSQRAAHGLYHFETPTRRCAVSLPFDPDHRIDQWQRLRQAMIRACPEPFRRDEWAYLITFLDRKNLCMPLWQSFGVPTTDSARPVDVLARPRGPVAVWLPNNVSLLGPLVVILLSLTGNPLRLKAGSQAEDLAGAFLEFARTRLPEGPLSAYLQRHVRLERFDRDDSRNRAMAAEAAVRIVFGSDETFAAVDALPHGPESIGLAFSDRRSEAWIEPGRLDEETLSALIRVFAIYGQAGCTSPGHVVLLDGSPKDAAGLCGRLLTLWPEIIRRDPPMHVASENVMARQRAAALGWKAWLTPRHGAVLAAGTLEMKPAAGRMTLPIVTATAEQAAARLPENIQTVGHALSNPRDPRWLSLLASTRVKRFVPIARMHHFGPTWDGWAFWRQMFEEVEVG